LRSRAGARLRVPVPIETERLVIRAFEPQADAVAMAEVYRDREVMRFVPGGALADRDAVEAQLQQYAAAGQACGFSSWAVVERRTQRPVGDAGFGIFEPTGDVELGYTLGRRYWGHGYATEAAAACLGVAFAHLSIARVIAVVDIENEASMRVAERVGMERVETVEAHGRPHVIFALTGGTR
jgi:RimJ/RimL family protein N-acetyltransferase